MNEKMFCQSCGMPMDSGENVYGTNEDKSINKDYCKYCYEDGKFTFNGTMAEMIEICVPHMANKETGFTEDVARNMMNSFFPTLKRWNNK